jgi:hypothetical protein
MKRKKCLENMIYEKPRDHEIVLGDSPCREMTPRAKAVSVVPEIVLFHGLSIYTIAHTSVLPAPHDEKADRANTKIRK